MIALLAEEEIYIYQNQSTLDKWEITYEEFHVLDDHLPPWRLTYTARFYLPEHMQHIEIQEPYLQTIPSVLHPLIENLDEAKNKMVVEAIDILEEIPTTNLVFRFTAVAEKEEDVVKKKSALYRELMYAIHSYSPLKTFPTIIRERIESGEIEY